MTVAEKLKELEIAPDGYEIQPGDFIVSDMGPFGKSVQKVTRVTAKYAFVKNNEVSEGKFPRIFSFGFQSLPRDTWNTIIFSVYIKKKQPIEA